MTWSRAYLFLGLPLSKISFARLLLRFRFFSSLSKFPRLVVYWSQDISGSWTTLCGYGSETSTCTNQKKAHWNTHQAFATDVLWNHRRCYHVSSQALLYCQPHFPHLIQESSRAEPIKNIGGLLHSQRVTISFPVAALLSISLNYGFK